MTQLSHVVMTTIQQQAAKAKQDLFNQNQAYGPYIEPAFNMIYQNILSAVAMQQQSAPNQFVPSVVYNIISGMLLQQINNMANTINNPGYYSVQPMGQNMYNTNMFQQPMPQNTSMYSGGSGLGSPMKQEVIAAANTGAKRSFIPEKQPEPAIRLEEVAPKETIVEVDVTEDEIDYLSDLYDDKIMKEETKQMIKAIFNDATDLVTTVESESKGFTYTTHSAKSNTAETLINNVNIVSKGFKSPYSVKQYVEDNILETGVEGHYTQVNYIRVIPFKIPYTDGVKLFGKFEKINKQNSTHSVLCDIKTLLDEVKSGVAEQINNFIINEVNQYTQYGFLVNFDPSSKYYEVKFDSVKELMDVLGSDKPDKHFAIWKNPEFKTVVDHCTSLALRKLLHAKVFDPDVTESAQFVLDCIGINQVDNGKIWDIEKFLLGSKTKANLEKLEGSKEYVAIKSYTVIGVNEVMAFTNIPSMTMCVDEESTPSYIPLVYSGLFYKLDNEMSDTLFDTVVNKYLVNVLESQLILEQDNNVTYGFRVLTNIDKLSLGPLK